jgi:FMN-binding domain
MRKALAVLAVTVVAVVALARYETHPPKRLNPNSALRAAASPPPAGAKPTPTPAPPRSGLPAGAPGTRSGTGPVITTPFSTIQVRATLRGHRLVGVETVSLSGSDPHTEALNARAEPILREEALKAGDAEVDAVSGATYTSESWRDSLAAAIARARR